MNSNINPTLALQQGLKRHMDGIVKAATEAALLLQDGNLQKNQIRNVLNVAEESSNVAVVTNFIRYQIGRSGTGKEWQHNGFGLRVIEDITAGPVHQTVANVIKVVSDRLGSEVVTAETATLIWTVVLLAIAIPLWIRRRNKRQYRELLARVEAAESRDDDDLDSESGW